LAVIDRIRETNKYTHVVFVGRKYTSEKEKQVESFEYKEVTARNIPFIHLSTGRLTRLFSLRSLQNIFQIPQGFFSAWRILKQEKPNAILSFGGYIALPIAICAKLLEIPVYTHEQTITPGLANNIIAQFADIIFLSFPESALYFKGKNIILSGNPIRKSIFQTNTKLSIEKDIPCIYVTGGSLGAHAVNVLIENILAELLEQYYVIHQTGNVTEFQDYDRLSKLKDALPDELKKRYIIKQHVSDEEIGAIYNCADIVIGRAGANTFFEMIALQKPTIFIPLPWSANGEQEHHAQIFKKHKTGEIVHQSEGSAQLLKIIQQITSRKEEYISHFNSLSTYNNINAADTIIETIFKE
ncbi:MAG TPA: glycosyltransferase, partial [Candidatus Woesebacteria bacterium]|nr:glycosyltransferase [Candidatus Woesebacteria bacterium]